MNEQTSKAFWMEAPDIAKEIRLFRESLTNEIQCLKSHWNLVTKQDLEQLERKIMASQSEITAILKGVSAQQRKTITEINTVQASVNELKTKITELEAIIAAGGEASEELNTAVSEVKDLAQQVDDQIPDAPTPVPEVPPTA